jgi:hypothetical protein
MAYLDNDYEGFDDESIAAILESDDNGSWESFGSGEAVGPRYRRNVGRNGSAAVPRPQPARQVGGLGGASLNTPAGRAQMKFEKPVATKESVDAAIRELKGELTAVAAAVKKVDETVDKNTAILDKKVAAIEAIQKRGQQSSQMGMLLPLLLNKPADLASLTLKPTTGTTPVEQTFTVSKTEYKEGDNMGLLIAMMAMSGGLGGGNGGDSMSMLLPLLLIGGLGGSKK